MISTKAERDRRIADNYDKHKHKFVGKTDQQVRELADNWLKMSGDPAISIQKSSQQVEPDLELMLLEGSFAAEEELLQRRGAKGVYDN